VAGRVTSAATDRTPSPPTRQGERGDAHEREADRVADAVLGGGTVPPISLGAIPLLQRDETASGQKSEEEKYRDAAKKAGEAFLKTAPGKEITAKAEQVGEAFISTLPGKIITGTPSPARSPRWPRRTASCRSASRRSLSTGSSPASR